MEPKEKLMDAAEAMVATAFGNTYGLTEADQIEAMREAAQALKVALTLLKGDTTGFSFEVEVEEEDDNRKLYQYIVSPDGKRHWLDHTPYHRLTQADFEKYVAFYKAHGRMPSREDIKSCGPLSSEKMASLAD